MYKIINSLNYFLKYHDHQEEEEIHFRLDLNHWKKNAQGDVVLVDFVISILLREASIALVIIFIVPKNMDLFVGTMDLLIRMSAPCSIMHASNKEELWWHTKDGVVS